MLGAEQQLLHNLKHVPKEQFFQLIMLEERGTWDHMPRARETKETTNKMADSKMDTWSALRVMERENVFFFFLRPICVGYRCQVKREVSWLLAKPNQTKPKQHIDSS